MTDPEGAAEARASAPTDRELAWVEYLVLMQAYDRTLPGHWQAPGLWCIRSDEETLRASVNYARRQHGRLVQTLSALLGRYPLAGEEVEVVERYVDLTHDERVALLAGRSVLDEHVGPDLLAPRKLS